MRRSDTPMCKPLSRPEQDEYGTCQRSIRHHPLGTQRITQPGPPGAARTASRQVLGRPHGGGWIGNRLSPTRGGLGKCPLNDSRRLCREGLAVEYWWNLDIVTFSCVECFRGAVESGTVPSSRGCRPPGLPSTQASSTTDTCGRGSPQDAGAFTRNRNSFRSPQLA